MTSPTSPTSLERAASPSGSPVLIYAGDVAITHAPGDLSSLGAAAAGSPTPAPDSPTAAATNTANPTATATNTAGAALQSPSSGTATVPAPTATAIAPAPTGTASAPPPTSAPTSATGATPTPMATATATATAVPTVPTVVATVAPSGFTGTIEPTAAASTRAAGSGGATPAATRTSGADGGRLPPGSGDGGRARLSGCARLDVRVGVSRRRLASGSSVMVRGRARAGELVTVTLALDAMRTVGIAHGRHPLHGVRWLRLYRMTQRAWADVKGQFSSRAQIGYAPARAMTARLTVTVRTRCDEVVHSVNVTVLPPARHARAVARHGRRLFLSR